MSRSIISMKRAQTFSKDYSTARGRFREAASRLGWLLEDYPIPMPGPAGEKLTLDVAYSPHSDPSGVLVVSSGVHGVEGFFGSAVQVALLEQWTHKPAPVKCLLLHGLNPYGFAWLRRVDESNIDLNRNFLLPGERFENAPKGYADLDSLLNPQRPPAYGVPFLLKALPIIARHGIPMLRQVVAAGQYEFPRGLFFGGTGPTRTHQALDQNFERWLRQSRQVVHLDFHTGLGPKGTCRLLIDYPLSETQRTCLTSWFGADSFTASESRELTYEIRGGFGRWCVTRNSVPNYLFACAEFDTYGPIQVLAGLRSENQAHHWGTPSDASTIRARKRLKELFCPAAESWRSQVLDRALAIVDRTLLGLTGTNSLQAKS